MFYGMWSVRDLLISTVRGLLLVLIGLSGLFSCCYWGYTSGNDGGCRERNDITFRDHSIRQQFAYFPNVIGQAALHCGRHAQSQVDAAGLAQTLLFRSAPQTTPATLHGTSQISAPADDNPLLCPYRHWFYYLGDRSILEMDCVG